MINIFEGNILFFHSHFVQRGKKVYFFFLFSADNEKNITFSSVFVFKVGMETGLQL